MQKPHPEASFGRVDSLPAADTGRPPPGCDGIDTPVPLLDGTERPYVFLDNAASTPAFGRCSGVSRNSSPGIPASTAEPDSNRCLPRKCSMPRMMWWAHSSVPIRRRNTVIFTKNTTECVNKLANRLALRPDDIVITTVMEHHSNDLPWRKHCHVVHIGVLRGWEPGSRRDSDRRCANTPGACGWWR